MKEKNTIKTMIIALDQSFGSVRIAREKESLKVFGIDLAPGIGRGLKEAKESGLRIVVMLTESLPASEIKVLAQYLPEADSIIPPGDSLLGMLAHQSGNGTRSAPSLRGASSGGFAPSEIVVAADRVTRGMARKAGALAASHLTIAGMMLNKRSPEFVRAVGNPEVFDRLKEVAPYFVETGENGHVNVLACMSRSAIAEATANGLRIEVLPLDLATEDPIFVHLDTISPRVAAELSRLKVLLREPTRVLVALGPEKRNDALQLHGRHGHFISLNPNPALFFAASPSSSALRRARIATGRLPIEDLELIWDPDGIDLAHLPLSCPTDAAAFQADVDRYGGAADLDAAGPIVSRHIDHPDNVRAVQALLDELNGIGYCAYTHDFTYGGRTLQNVIADLPGKGFFRLDPDILKRLRDVLIKFPFPDPPDPWMGRIEAITGKKWLEDRGFFGLEPLAARQRLEALLELRPSFPWWVCTLAGFGSEIVIVGCHLDSTASRSAGYNPATDPAPGVDDDASGIAATLSLARYLWNFRGTLPHTVRFCFFNAEEHGLVGSRAYAAMLKAADAPIRAVVCSDMIGYNSDSQRLFEVHAGYTNAAVRDISVPLADTIASWAGTLGALAPAQIYRGTNGGSGSDRNIFDGAINRSDHAAFHEQGYPAVVVSEDFFVNLASEPGADPNPNYHDEDDLVIDSAYAADITCAVAHAVREFAGG